MHARRGPHGKSPPRDSEERSEPSRSRRKDFIGELDPRAAQDAERGGHFRARFVRFQSLGRPHSAVRCRSKKASRGLADRPARGRHFRARLTFAFHPGQARRVTLALRRAWACFHRVRPLQKRGKRAPIARQIASQAPKTPSISFNFLHFLSANQGLSMACAVFWAKKKISLPRFRGQAVSDLA